LDRIKTRENAAIARVTVAVNGDDVPPSDRWVTQAVKDEMNNAITAAAALSDAAYLALSSALKIFNAAQQPGSTPDTEALLAALNSADAARTEVVIAVNSAGAAAGSAWVTQAQWDALNTAYNAANGAATKNAVDQMIVALNTAITTFNNAKTANGPGTKEETGEITISGIGTLYKDGTSVEVGLVSDKSLSVTVTYGIGTVTSGALTVSLGSWDGSYYICFTSDNKLVFVSKTEATVSGGTASIAYTDFELLILPVKLGDMDMGILSSMTLNNVIQIWTVGECNDYTTYKDFWYKELLGVLADADRYVNLNSLLDGRIAIYKDAACTQEFSGTDMVGPDTVIYTHFPIVGNNESNEEDVDAVGHITGSLTFTGYTGQRPQVRINAEYFDGMGGYWVEHSGGRYTVNSDGSFSIPFTQQFLTALNKGTLDLRLYLDIGSGNSQFSKRIEPMIKVTASQLSNGNLNLGSQGPVSLASITLSGTISVTLNGQVIPRVQLYADGSRSDNTTLTSPGSNAPWSITMAVLDSPTNLNLNIFGYDSEGNQLIYKNTGITLSGVHNTNVSGVVINLGNITTVTLNGTVTIDGQNPNYVNIGVIEKINDYTYSQIGFGYIPDYDTKAHTWSIPIETLPAGTEVYFRLEWRNSSGEWHNSERLPNPIIMPYDGKPIALTYDGSGN
jgi:hypothetical protein